MAQINYLFLFSYHSERFPVKTLILLVSLSCGTIIAKQNPTTTETQLQKLREHLNERVDELDVLRKGLAKRLQVHENANETGSPFDEAASKEDDDSKEVRFHELVRTVEKLRVEYDQMEKAEQRKQLREIRNEIEEKTKEMDSLRKQLAKRLEVYELANETFPGFDDSASEEDPKEKRFHELIRLVGKLRVKYKRLIRSQMEE